MLPLALSAQGKKAPKKQEDSLARLVKADTLQLVEIRGITYRKVMGRQAVFLHNDTYLYCDSALWNVDTKVIDAMGHVKLQQERTTLTSDKLTYFVDRDVAEFRGSVVQLVDQDKNTLRTKYLDYNTKDSVAIFRNGASMRDKDGQIIESRTGVYDSKVKTFTFNDDVNMFSDTLFVKTSYLKYESDVNTATFGYGTYAWKDDNMLAANAGWYNRDEERFFFNRQVHVMSEDQEAWSDSLFFNRVTNDVTMLGNAQVTDTTRNVFAVAGKLDYRDTLGQVLLTRAPAIVSIVEEKDEYGEIQRDSVFVGADTLIHRSIPKNKIDSVAFVRADERLKSIDVDPVSAHRKAAAEAARKAAEEAAANDPNNPDNAKRKAKEAEGAGVPEGEAGAEAAASKSSGRRSHPTTSKKSEDEAAAGGTPAGDELSSGSEAASPSDDAAESPSDSLTTAPADSLAAAMDSTGIAPMDSLGTSIPEADGDEPADPAGQKAGRGQNQKQTSVEESDESSDEEGEGDEDGEATEPTDSTAVQPIDTTKLSFVEAFHNVKVYRKTMQVVCDSLSYTDLDSLARLYYTPMIWNEEGRHQYCADSVYAVIHNGAMEKANLISNSFIHIQEDTVHFDQIKSTEMTAFFDEESQLSRFDALGGATALFYIEENGTLATVNRKESKMLSAHFNNGEIEKIYYFEGVKSDAYPVVQMSYDDQHLKGFLWSPESRPASRYDVTDLKLRPSQRTKYSAIEEPKFVQTEIYFPGYINDIHRQIVIRDSLKIVKAERDRERKALEESMREQVRLDSLNNAFDSLAVRDSLGGAADSLASGLDSLANGLDSLAAGRDSLAVGADSLAAKPSEPAVVKERDPKEVAAEIKAAKKAEREAKKKARIEAREARWAAQDAKEAEKLKKKEEKAAAKARAKKLKALKAQAKEEAKDQEAINAYIRRYQKKIEKKNK